MKKHYHQYNSKPARHQPAYPNAADSNYFAGKAMEILTAVTSGFGVITAMVFLVILA